MNIGVNLPAFRFGNEFSDTIPKVQATKYKINWIVSKLKFCASKDNQESEKTTYRKGEKIYK